MLPGKFGPVVVLPGVPTAENIARACYLKLAPRVEERSERRARLARVRLYETPNCWADYAPQDEAGDT
jgi:6-pyruvoyltetrahydropterin/6-carboxytetrahydropterin synthase